MKNRACIYRQYGGPAVLEVVEDWPYPDLSDDGVLIKVAAVSINPKDTLLRKGMFRVMARTPLPRATAMDASGNVVEVGKNVRGFRPGDPVYGMTNRFAGGLLCDYVTLPASEVALAPRSLAIEQAAAIPLAALTALQALRDCAQVREDSDVLVVGASGGVGHFALQIGNALGATVDAACSQANIDYVKTLGARNVWDYRACELSELDNTYDVIFDVSGHYHRSDFANQLGRRGIFISTVPTLSSIGGELLSRLKLKHTSRLVIVRSNRPDLEQLQTWVDQGCLTPCITQSFTLAEVASAHRQIESGHTRGKIVITT